MEHARHVLRVALLVLVLFSGLVVARGLLIPDSFGKYGHYRYDNVIEQRNTPLAHYGAKSCRGCHEKQWQLRESGDMEGHLKVSCEVCHGPLARHASGENKATDKKFADMPVVRSWQLCAQCHLKLEGRPASFPQVTFDSKHMKGDKLEGDVCKKCHDPHSTLYPEPEKEAEAAAPAKELDK